MNRELFIYNSNGEHNQHYALRSTFSCIIAILLSSKNKELLVGRYYDESINNLERHNNDYQLALSIISSLLHFRDDEVIYFSFGDCLYANFLSNLSVITKGLPKENAEDFFDSITNVYETYPKDKLLSIALGETELFMDFLRKINGDVNAKHTDDCCNPYPRLTNLISTISKNEVCPFFPFKDNIRLNDFLSSKIDDTFEHLTEKDPSIVMKTNILEDGKRNFLPSYPINQSNDNFLTVLAYVAKCASDMFDDLSYGNQKDNKPHISSFARIMLYLAFSNRTPCVFQKKIFRFVSEIID